MVGIPPRGAIWPPRLLLQMRFPVERQMPMPMLLLMPPMLLLMPPMPPMLLVLVLMPLPVLLVTLVRRFGLSPRRSLKRLAASTDRWV